MSDRLITANLNHFEHRQFNNYSLKKEKPCYISRVTYLLGDVIGEYSQKYHWHTKSGFMKDTQSIVCDEKTHECKLDYFNNKYFNISRNGMEWKAVSTKDFRQKVVRNFRIGSID